MTTTKTERLQELMQINFEWTQVIAHKTGSNTLSAYKFTEYVLECLERPVSDKIFIGLIKLCMAIGPHEFRKSWALYMANKKKCRRSDVIRCIDTMIRNHEKECQPIVW